MSFKQTVEENVVIWLLGMLALGFGAGFGAYRTILEVSDQTTILKTRKADLESKEEQLQEIKKTLAAGGTAPPEKYEIQGKVNLNSGAQRFPYEKIQLCIRPPDLVVYPDGFVRGNISVSLNKEKKLIDPPKLVIDSGREDYIAAVVHLLNEGERGPFGVTDYDVEVNHEAKLIRLRKPVDFLPASSQGYNTSQQIPTPIVR
ncbi:hypothetical protein EWI61_10200 [Methylolobus aquaticus]|nr:hypothetical protein EWI61_10200 [Methylolobus aquaticus]